MLYIDSVSPGGLLNDSFSKDISFIAVFRDDAITIGFETIV